MTRSAPLLSPVTAFIGLGSNLENPKKQIFNAIKALKNLPYTHFVSDAGYFLSEAMVLGSNQQGGSINQPDYINTVAEIQTTLSHGNLLTQCQIIENNQARIREERWGPRTIDLDILLYGDQQIHTDNLDIPHPGMPERAFVLYPLKKLRPELEIPGHGKLETLIQHCPEDGLKYLGVLGDI